MLAYARGAVKRALVRWPAAYTTLKRGYEIGKRTSDARRVRKVRPGVEIVNFSKSEVEQSRADGFHAQFGQDKYLQEEIFRGMAGGSFLDIGCNHPIANNNSLFFESRGWSGLAFDPIERFAAEWSEHRKARFFRVAISEEPGEREFIEFIPREGWEHQLSGFADTVRREDLAVHAYRSYPVPCGPLREFAPDLEHVDIAFIDVEGAEEFVIRGLGLRDLTIDWILVENMQEIGGSERVRVLLESFGYKMRARIAATDDLFQRC